MFCLICNGSLLIIISQLSWAVEDGQWLILKSLWRQSRSIDIKDDEFDGKGTVHKRHLLLRLKSDFLERR